MNYRKLIFDWRIKVIGEKIVSFLPFGIDYKIYSSVAHKFLGIKSSSFEQRIEKGVRNLELIKAKSGFKCQNKTVLELGTGLHGVDLLLFSILGCKRILTLDHIQHVKKELIVSAYKTLGTKLEDIAQRLEVNLEDLKSRYDQVNTQGSLHELFVSLRVTPFEGIVPDPKAIEPNSVDLFYSESCLQRIPTPTLQKIFDILSGLLSENAFSFHRLDTKDINSIWFKDLWGLNYLKYSDFTWKLLTAKKFNNQNRLREQNFITLFKKAGLNSLYVESYVRPDDVSKLEKFPVAKRFRELPLKEIAVVHSKIISSKRMVEAPRREFIHDF